MVYVHTKFDENRPIGSKAEITCARTTQHGDGQNLLSFCSQEGKQDSQAVLYQRKTKKSPLQAETDYCCAGK
jgi:hypothetical protein